MSDDKIIDLSSFFSEKARNNIKSWLLKKCKCDENILQANMEALFCWAVQHIKQDHCICAVDDKTGEEFEAELDIFKIIKNN